MVHCGTGHASDTKLAFVLVFCCFLFASGHGSFRRPFRYNRLK
jgi:hypothetical protein